MQNNFHFSISCYLIGAIIKLPLNLSSNILSMLTKFHFTCKLTLIIHARNILPYSLFDVLNIKQYEREPIIK